MPSHSLVRRCLRLLFSSIASLWCLAALADPSARVGRLAYLEGAVEFRGDPRDTPAPAFVNLPLTTGNMIATGVQSRAELRVGSSVIRLDAKSLLEITALDDERIGLSLTRGSATVRIRNVDVTREFFLQTPQGQVLLLQPGRLRIDAGVPASAVGAATITTVHVIDGSARFDPVGGQAGVVLAAGSRLDSRNGNSQVTDLHAPQAADRFDAWSLARDAGDDRSQAVPYVSAETTGYEELDRHGVWLQTPEYGAVWTPTVVVAGWAPYRAGRWIWVRPWGWTWVDSAPWAYAPSHYGRWVAIDNRWCWAPGAVVARPVWSPALVGWNGGQRWNASLQSASPPTGGWYPLAPRDVYVPPYVASRNYLQRVNITQVNNLNRITQVSNVNQVNKVNLVNNVTEVNNFRGSRDPHRGAGRDAAHDDRNGRAAGLASLPLQQPHLHLAPRRAGTSYWHENRHQPAVVSVTPVPAASPLPQTRAPQVPEMPHDRRLQHPMPPVPVAVAMPMAAGMPGSHGGLNGGSHGGQHGGQHSGAGGQPAGAPPHAGGPHPAPAPAHAP